MSQTLTINFARPWRTHPRETMGLAILSLAAVTALAGAASSTSRLPQTSPAIRAGAPLPALPDVRAVRPVAPQTALEINGQIPLAGGPNPAARPFKFSAADGESRARALECLTSAIYYEAGRESADGQRAVAQVVLNRVRHPAFPASVCGVVYQGSTRATGCQFTFTCDGSLAYAPERAVWNRASKIAWAALNGTVHAPVGNATHYHANYVVPYWAPTLAKISVVGAHIFYRWSGGWGRPAAFAQRYSGRESDPRVLRAAAMSAPRGAAATLAEAAELDKVPGVEVKQVDKLVRVRFSLKAREAVEATPHVDYVDRVAASDNLRFALKGGSSGEPERPFGRNPGAGTQQTQ